MTRSEFVVLLRLAMDKQGMTQAELARALDIRYISVWLMLNSGPDRVVRRGTLYRYARALRLPNDWFLTQRGAEL